MIGNAFKMTLPIHGQMERWPAFFKRSETCGPDMTSIRQQHKAIRLLYVHVILWLFAFLPATAFSQDFRPDLQPILVGTMEAPPFLMKAPDGKWEGLGIDIWQALAQELRLSFKFKEFESFSSLLAAIQKQEVDLTLAFPVRKRFVDVLDYGVSYAKTGLSIAVPTETYGSNWRRISKTICSIYILQAFGLLIVASLFFGAVLWFFERKRNPEMFGMLPSKGLGDGIWWAIVTLTTVGYGDTAPKTALGRMVAVLWMVFSIIFISSFTANITTSLTIGELGGRVRGLNDLHTVRVGSIANSEASYFLDKHGIGAITFQSARDGMLAVAGKQIDAFVMNEAILKYLAKRNFPGRVRVLAETFDPYFLAMAMQEGSALRKPLNKALLKFMESDKWENLLKEYNYTYQNNGG